MRFLMTVTALSLVLGAGAAQAERRMFIIPGNAGAYGIDRCLASGAACGAAVATAYCQSRQFDRALSFRKVDRDEITGAVPGTDARTCPGGSCADFVAVVCER